MPNHDRRHSVAVARRVQRALDGTEHAGDTTTGSPLRCSTTSASSTPRLGVFGRVGATLAGAAAGHDMAPLWSKKRGITRRVGLYLRHPELGADRIRVAGGPDVAARWAAAHHDRTAWDATGHPDARARRARTTPTTTERRPRGSCVRCGGAARRRRRTRSSTLAAIASAFSAPSASARCTYPGSRSSAAYRSWTRTQQLHHRLGGRVLQRAVALPVELGRDVVDRGARSSRRGSPAGSRRPASASGRSGPRSPSRSPRCCSRLADHRRVVEQGDRARGSRPTSTSSPSAPAGP